MNYLVILTPLGFALASCLGMYLVARLTTPPRVPFGPGRKACKCGRGKWHGLCNPQRCLAPYPEFFTTPKDWSRCRNLVKDGPTPCWHPHCDCMTTDYAEPRPPLGHDEILRRHLHATQKAKHERSRPKA
jgi:hypothetical protein